MQHSTRTTVNTIGQFSRGTIKHLLCGISLLFSANQLVHADETMTNGPLTSPNSTISANTANQSHLAADSALGTPVLNVNTANALELSSIKGIGFKKAQAIVTYRETHGNFTNIEQLTLVQGIGKKMLARMQASITVNEPSKQRSKKAAKQPPGLAHQ